MVGVVVGALPSLHGVVVGEQSIFEVHALSWHDVSATVKSGEKRMLTLVGDGNAIVIGEPPVLCGQVVIACPNFQGHATSWLCEE